MKLSTVLSASVLAGAVILSATACSAPGQSEEQPKPATTSASPMPTATSAAKNTPAPEISSSPVKAEPDASAVPVPAEVVSPAKTTAPSKGPVPVKTVAPTVPIKKAPVTSAPVQTDADKVASVLTGYYDFVSSPNSLAKVKQTGSKFYGRPDVTDAELSKIAADFPEGFKYFDVSSSQSITNAYYQLFANATQSSRTPGTKPVTVPAKAVTINGEKATVKASMLTFADGKPVTGAPYFTFDPIKLVKAKDGSWVMIPEPPRHALL